MNYGSDMCSSSKIVFNSYVQHSLTSSLAIYLLSLSFFNLCTSQLLHYLKKVDFTNEFGEETKFDANGDAVAMYDLINFQLSETGEVRYATVGTFDETKSIKLLIEENLIIWNGNQRQVSLCVF